MCCLTFSLPSFSISHTFQYINIYMTAAQQPASKWKMKTINNLQQSICYMRRRKSDMDEYIFQRWLSYFLLLLRYESSTLILYKELSSTIFQSCEWVRHRWHLSRSPLCAIYKGINALYWHSIINYQLLPPHSVLYWPSTQLHHLVTHSWANWI